MEKAYHVPDTGRLSTITAGILFGYALLPILRITAREVSFPFLGVLIVFRFNFYYVVSIITAIMAATGMDWIMRDHPALTDRPRFAHLILPALTTAAIGVPLGLLETGNAWWIILALGSGLVVMVMLAEYISLDSQDSRYPLALMVLSGTSFSLMLILSIALRAADVRLYLMLLILTTVFIFFILRILNFRLGGQWRLEWTAVIVLISAQFIIALFYWPLSPVRFGLLLLGIVYALTGVAVSLDQKPDLLQVFLEPLFVMGFLWVLAIFLG